MAIDPEELLPRKPKRDLVVGEDIYTLSVTELESRIAALEAEIVRVREALQVRTRTRSAADAAFKR